MSRNCRHISVTVQAKAPLAVPPPGRVALPRVRLDTVDSFEAL
jgi:hypothetical protein